MGVRLTPPADESQGRSGRDVFSMSIVSVAKRKDAGCFGRVLLIVLVAARFLPFSGARAADR